MPKRFFFPLYVYMAFLHSGTSNSTRVINAEQRSPKRNLLFIFLSDENEECLRKEPQQPFLPSPVEPWCLLLNTDA